MNTKRVVAMLACLSLGCLTSVTRAELVGLWRFDQDVSPQPDSSGKGHSGQPMNEVTWVDDFERGGTMEFDGDADYLEVEDTDLLSIEGDLTITAWARFESFDGYNSIVSKTGLPELNNHNRPAPFDFYTVNAGNGIPRFYAGSGDDSIGNADGFDPPELEEWVHLAVTLSEDGDVFQYMNGEDNGSGFIESPPIDLDQNLFIGSRADFVTNMFGQLDDVALFNEVLSEEQIMSVMAGDFTQWGVGDNIPLGDFNKNGEVDEPDVNLLSAEIAGGGNDLSFDLNGDDVVDAADHGIWVSQVRNIWFGDANMDGEFNTTDLVQVLSRGEYEDDVALNSEWGDGDWNADLEFNTSDLVAALSGGGYENGAKPASFTQAVPEPTGLLLLTLGWLGLMRRRDDSR